MSANEDIRQRIQEFKKRVQSHHIFPTEILKRTQKYSPFVQKAIEGGYNNELHRIELPETIHKGPHHGYSRWLEAQIEDFDKVDKAINWTPPQAREQLELLIREAENVIKTGIDADGKFKMK